MMAESIAVDLGSAVTDVVSFDSTVNYVVGLGLVVSPRGYRSILWLVIDQGSFLWFVLDRWSTL